MYCQTCQEPTTAKNKLCSPCNSARMKRYYASMKAQVFNHYGKVCSCCGEAEPMFLSLDHTENNGNKEVWASGRRITGTQLYSKLVKRGFPTGYQILCMNCNFGKHFNNGICPHGLIQ